MTDINVEMDSTHRGLDSDVEDVEVAQDTSAVATLTVEAIKGKCPPHGSEVAVVCNFRIARVRNALGILGIAVSDRRDSGVCKAALAQYYQDLNASRTEANQAQGGTEGADGPHEDSDAGAAVTAGSGNVSAGSTDAAGAADITHAALRQQLSA